MIDEMQCRTFIARADIALGKISPEKTSFEFKAHEFTRGGYSRGYLNGVPEPVVISIPFWSGKEMPCPFDSTAAGSRRSDH